MEALEIKQQQIKLRPYIPQLTTISAIIPELPDNPTPITFLDFYEDDEYFTLATNLFAAQYLQSNASPCSHFQKFKDVSLAEMKHLPAFRPLLVEDLVIAQCTDL